jgi:hypothetical protein
MTGGERQRSLGETNGLDPNPTRAVKVSPAAI